MPKARTVLKPCPNSPNCVSSANLNSKNHVPPLSYESALPEAIQKMREILESMNQARIVTNTEDYIHAEFTSGFFRFVDDLELLFNDAEKSIHVRSASRTGYYDFGVNRKRVDEIRKRFGS